MPHGKKLKILSLHKVRFRMKLKNAIDMMVSSFAPSPDNI